MFGPPVSLVLGLVALFRDRSGRWARIDLSVSLVMFALWLACVLGGGF